jgi:hypothetical protein
VYHSGEEQTSELEGSICKRGESGKGGLLVGFSAVANSSDIDPLLFISNRVNDSIIAYANTP